MFQKLRRNLERSLFGRDPHYHDPYEDPAEQFYARIYLKYLFERINAEFRQQQVKILDVGCHTGRLSIPLARAGHEVIAIDSSRFHLRRAEQHAQAEGVSCQFIKGDAFKRIHHMEASNFDLVLCTEVLYQLPNFRDCMHALARILRPGGILATSHRSQFFYLTQALRKKDFDTARQLLNQSEGELWGSYFNWQSPEELRDLYGVLGMEQLTVRAVGALTGNGEEGMASLCNLAEATELEREALFEVETQDAEEFAAIGRYLFIMGRKVER